MKKGILNLQFWEGDRAVAADLARLLVSLEPYHRGEYDLLLTNRFDCPPLDGRTISELSRRFDIYTCQSWNQATGWPRGCNYLWLDSMQWLGRNMGSKLPRYKWVLCMESDDCPLSKNWLDELDAEWDSIGLRVIGDVVQFPKYHVNGNAMFSAAPDFMEFIAKIKKLPDRGWDYYLADRFRWWGWAKTPAIKSVWGTSSVSPGQVDAWRAEGVRMLHGVKDGSVRTWARNNLLRAG